MARCLHESALLSACILLVVFAWRHWNSETCIVRCFPSRLLASVQGCVAHVQECRSPGTLYSAAFCRVFRGQSIHIRGEHAAHSVYGWVAKLAQTDGLARPGHWLLSSPSMYALSAASQVYQRPKSSVRRQLCGPAVLHGSQSAYLLPARCPAGL